MVSLPTELQVLRDGHGVLALTSNGITILEHPSINEFVSMLQRRKLRPEEMKAPSFEMKELAFEPKGLTSASACPGWEVPWSRGELRWEQVYKASIGQCP